MKKAFCLSAILGGVLAFTLPAGAQTTPATACPVNYVCSLEISGAKPLIGLGNDGQPVSIVGFVTFDGSGNVTAVIEANANGTVSTYTDTGTCTSGTATAPGTIALTSPRDGKVMVDFVVAKSFAGIELLVTNHTSESNKDTTVQLGVCHASAAG